MCNAVSIVDTEFLPNMTRSWFPSSMITMYSIFYTVRMIAYIQKPLVLTIVVESRDMIEWLCDVIQWLCACVNT
ncbi:hypothetical protein BD309DRAFT_974851 [Dichomitus squalens]|nr:hypothetical protein BD309DRAFT_974851 [Dichomitus squalens]